MVLCGWLIVVITPAVICWRRVKLLTTPAELTAVPLASQTRNCTAMVLVVAREKVVLPDVLIGARI